MQQPSTGSGYKDQPQRSFSSPMDAILNMRNVPTHEWVYQNKYGQDVLWVWRMVENDGKKMYLPLYKKDNGYVFGYPRYDRPLFLLPYLQQGPDPVIICEGEKSASAVADQGWTATTSSGGAKSHKKTDWSPLYGRRCVIWPDNDHAGMQYAEEVSDHLAGRGAVVTTMDPIGVDHTGWDAADCASLGLNISELIWMHLSLAKQNCMGYVSQHTQGDTDAISR
jgi:hypothetical protein